jgi:hypothetical protein
LCEYFRSSRRFGTRRLAADLPLGRARQAPALDLDLLNPGRVAAQDRDRRLRSSERLGQQGDDRGVGAAVGGGGGNPELEDRPARLVLRPALDGVAAAARRHAHRQAHGGP